MSGRKGKRRAPDIDIVHIMNKQEDPSGAPIGGAQSIRRAMALIRRVTEAGRDGAPVAALAGQTGIDRTTAHRILKCMAEEGMLSQSSGGRYILGPLAFEIGLAAGERLDLRTKCRAALTRIAAETGDTVFLMTRDGYESVCADRIEGGYPVKTLVVEVGNRRPLGIGAGSLAILSALPADEAETAITHNQERLAGFDNMSADRLRRLVGRARTEGKASLPVIGIPGVHALAVAVRTPGGRPIAALSVAAIRSRMTAQRQADTLDILRREATSLTNSVLRDYSS
jgi:DNA-binding IclR family transcriptional regulator